MPGLCRILTLGQIWQLFFNPDPDKNLHTKSVHSKYVCRNIFFKLILVKNKFKVGVGVHFGFDLRTPFYRFLGVLDLTSYRFLDGCRKEKNREGAMNNSQHQPLAMIFQVNSNIV